ncbi:hypothetical protein FV242_30685 [Methylobacterium sp. WL64]|uniref:hypothetical protein n=1 Tax=Methylobacterium sp. WL64 TaxID=2603894 RepID=UPI0011CB1521|nr:hypothetical protein [Methylobacterium sp. WL64]TXM97764.1 hypothetical protein FV242_30685 [Methylobacterium sp. WL64]
MAMPDVNECEIQIGGAWRPIGLAEAHARYPSAIKRCPICHGRVSINVNGTAQGGLFLQHRKAHDGCPLMPARFVGEISPHPQAVE